jgi:hypothetical protein
MLAMLIMVMTLLLLPLHFSAEQLLGQRIILAGFVRLVVVVVMVIAALVFVHRRVQVELLGLFVFFLCGCCRPFDALQSIALPKEATRNEG